MGVSFLQSKVGKMLLSERGKGRCRNQNRHLPQQKRQVHKKTILVCDVCHEIGGHNMLWEPSGGNGLATKGSWSQ